MLKKTLSVALSLVLLVGVSGIVPVMAATEAKLTLSGSTTAEPGNQISVVVGIADNPGIISARLVIGYDEEYLELRDTEYEEEYVIATGFRTPEYYYSNNQLVIIMERTNDHVNWVGDTFMTLVFTVKKAGSVTINLSSNDIINDGLEQLSSNIASSYPHTVNTSGGAATAPGVPTIGSATAGNGQATVRFTPPANDGGATITEYTITATPGNITRTATSSPFTFTGLTNGTAYTFTVTATNSAGTSAASADSNSVTPNEFGAPATGVADMTGYITALLVFIVLSVALWGYILRRRLTSGKNG